MILQVKNGNYSYTKPKKGETPNFLYTNDINFELHPGEILSVLGPNGAGKTTLLKCMMGLLKWGKGSTLLDGKPLTSLNSKDVWKKIGYVPQASQMTFSYSILELVTMGRAIYIRAFAQPSKKDQELALEALELVGIKHLANQACTAVSGGELQLALIARTLVAEPEILVLDEPESHLDMQKQKVILQTIKKLVKVKGLACIINTHYANHAFYLGDKVLMVAKELPVITGNVFDIMTEAHILNYFQIDVKRLRNEIDGQVYETMVPTYFGIENNGDLSK